MLRLVINNQDVELYENAPVNLKFQFSDVEKINNPLASYSQSFRVPLTQNNVDIFGHLDQVTEVGGLDLRQRLSAQLLSDTYPILDGFVQVKAVYLTKEIYPEVELVFFSSAVDFKSELEGLYLSDLNLNSLNHDLTLTNVQLSWLGNLDYIYGIVDTGQNWTADTFGTEESPLSLPQLTLFVKAKALLDKIFSEAGLTYESTYLEGSDFDDQFVMYANGSTVVESNDQFLESARTTLASDQTIAANTTAIVDLVDNGVNCYDQGGNWDNPSNKYTVPENGLYNVYALVDVNHNGTFQNRDWTARVVVDPASGGANYNLWEQDFFDSIRWDWRTELSPANGGYSGPVVLNANDVVYLEIQNREAGATLTAEANNNFSSGRRTSFEVAAVSPLGGYEVNVAASAPKMLQFDYLTSLQKLYNLVFIPDELKPGHFHIETFEDYMASGDTKDWSSKVDYGKDVVIKPTTDLQAAQYRWTYSSGKDFVTKTVEDSLARVYGQYEVTDTGNEFATGTNEVKTKFAPYLLSLVPNSPTPILRLITQDGKAIKDPAPRIAYYAGLGDTFGSLDILNESGTQFTMTQIPTMSNYNVPQPDPGDKDLNYGMEPAMYPISAQPANTLYFRFWATYVLELYSTEARVLSCNMNLTEADLQSWSFNDKIYIKDTYYRILSISYDANAPGTAQVELIRKLDDIEVCADTPTGLLSNSDIVTFNNSPIDYGSEACCVLYGYDWRINRETFEARCHVNTQQLDI
jgi:hypothetical protein